MITESDIEDKAYACVLEDLANKIFTVGAHIIMETDDTINDPMIGRGWSCILNDVVNDSGRISKALKDDEKKGGLT